ncbi:hypothetical protein ACHAO7_008553 [Fusarium culmorum]
MYWFICVCDKDSSAEASPSVKIPQQAKEKSPQRLIELGSWTPNISTQERIDFQESVQLSRLVSHILPNDEFQARAARTWTRVLRDEDNTEQESASEQGLDTQESDETSSNDGDTGNNDIIDTDANDNDNSDSEPNDVDIDNESEDQSTTSTLNLETAIEYLQKGYSLAEEENNLGEGLGDNDLGDDLDTDTTWRFVRHITISRDQTHASGFDKERLAALLEQDWRDIDQYTHNYDQYKQHTGLVPSIELAPGSGSNHALQDYQMQLMLLEQQNKKRLMMARQEQDAIMGGGSSTKDSTIPSLPTTNMEDVGDNGKDVAPANHVQIAQIQQEIERLRRIQNTLKSTTWLVLHKIQGDETTYIADPSWAPKQGQAPYFRGNSPLANESEYLKHRSDAAFVVYRHYDPTFQAKDIRKAREEGLPLPYPKPAWEVVQPLSEQMIAALDEFVDSHPTFRDKFPGWRSTDPINSPFLFWYCYRAATDLQAMDEPHRKQMTLLTEWIDNNYSEMHAAVEDKFSQGFVSEATMPFFIRPGEVLVSMNERGISGHIAETWPTQGLTNYASPSHPNGPRKVTQRWSVGAWSYGYDGKFYKNSTVLTISLEFDEDSPDVSIVKVNILPIRFGNKDFRTKLERRGRTMWACKGRNLIAYNDISENNLSSEGERYMIDFNTYKQLHSDSHKFKMAYPSLTNPYRKEMEPSVMESDEPPEGAELFVFPSTVVGYNLRQKKWQDLQIDWIQELHWNKQAFRHLVIDEETKDIIQALVTSKLETDQTTDLIQGKGNGLIILLHGGPGTGKTFTAESVAELAEKPLFRVTCGDIGTKPEEVEKYLESVLHLGKIWGCVVLLDEADVFLEQRTLTDLERNALVSVFLRVLEYYEGILILTSNRVGTFDEAFKSRIQLSLHYESLSKSQRRTIWTNFLQRLQTLEKTAVVQPITDRKRKYEIEQDINFDDIERHLGDLAEEEMNGRQIRNAITTARQLAKFKNESSLAVTTLSESTTTILPVSSSAETSLLDTTLASQATETIDTETATTVITRATSVDTTTVDDETSTTLLDITITTEAATTTAGEITTTAAETTTTAAAGCPQVTVLANPTSIFSSSEGKVFDDEQRTVVIPFDVGVFGASSSTLYVSVNGLLTLGRAPNTASFNAALPAQSLPEVAIMPYWSDLLVFPNLCGSGIAYEIYDTSRGQTFTVEYYVGIYGNPVGEHFTVSLYKDYPGLVRYVYYKTSRHGSSATVGVQNGMFKSQYSYNAEDSIPDRFWVEIDTSAIHEVTTSDGDFQGGN